jgi:hypothetical protein
MFMSLRKYLARMLGRHPRGPTTVSPEGIKAALGALEQFEAPPHLGRPGGPIFVFATGWRCGSTLLQRILMTDPRLLLWGEPMGRAAILPHLVEALSAVTAAWPPRGYFIGERAAGGAHHKTWIATLYPNPPDLRAALRAFGNRWLADPARAAGFARWGFKEVRFGASEAYLLRWLYPDAQFVLLTRDPCAAFWSMRRSSREWRMMERWPDRRVDTPEMFAEVWNRIALSWSDASCQDLRPVLLRYEDIVAGRTDFAALARQLGLAIEPAAALALRIGASPDGAPLAARERRAVLAGTAAGRRALGY